MDGYCVDNGGAFGVFLELNAAWFCQENRRSVNIPPDMWYDRIRKKLNRLCPDRRDRQGYRNSMDFDQEVKKL